MYAARTTYEICHKPADYERCHAFCKAEADHPQRQAEGLPPYQYERLLTPTVMVIRDGQVIGVMGTKKLDNDAWLVNPFHIAYSLKNPIPTAIRLIDTYEALLRKKGITAYRIVMPTYKPSARKIFELYKGARTLQRTPDRRLVLYLVPVH
jgi:hypothetical protein